MATRPATRSRRPAKPKLPTREPLDGLKLSPEVAWYLLDRGIGLPEPWQVPLWKTPEPREREGARFDPARVDRVIGALRRLRHTQGKWAGQPLEPAPWQVAYILAPSFGWVIWDDEADALVRVARTLYADLPRKNGKTTTAGGIGIYLTAADGEQGAQVLAVAASKDQAGYCFNPVKTLAQSSPDLAPYVRALARKIVHKASGSYFAVVASVGDLLHGANVHGAFLDAEVKKAQSSPANLARYLRLHLGIRTKQATRFIRLEDWDAPANAVPIDEVSLAGRKCHGGLDMGSVSDLTALCWIFPDRV